MESNTMINDRRWIMGALLVATAILIFFHNRSWYPPDDGIYAHIAHRLLNGKVLNGDIQNLHGGVPSFIHAASLYLFGESLVSFRYALVALGLVQCVLVFRLMPGTTRISAFAASTATVAYGFVLFPNPSANWYALFLATLLTYVMSIRADSNGKFVLIGLLIGICFLTRQLSAVFLAMGALAGLAILPNRSEWGSDRDPVTSRSEWLGRATLIMICVGILLYFGFVSRDSAAFLLFGLFPALVAGWTAFNPSIRPELSFHAMGRMLTGYGLAFIPLVAYHMFNGTVASWIHDVFLLPFTIPALDFVGERSYVLLLTDAIAGFLSGLSELRVSAIAASGLILWFMLAPMILGFFVMKRVVRNQWAGFRPLHVVALFFAMVSAHYAIPIYLYFSAGLTTAALLDVLVRQQFVHFRIAAYSTLLGAGCAVLFLAGRSPATLDRVLAGVAEPKTYVPREQRLGLWIETDDAHAYGKLVDRIQNLTPPDSPIFVFPAHPEIYFVANRPNPTIFANMALGVRSCLHLGDLIDSLRRKEVGTVVQFESDKYATRYSELLADWLALHYVMDDSIGEARIFVKRDKFDKLPAISCTD
ncbi:MAG: hypothetical protein RQ826_13670 [Xanthomonadales bacterium]|nr:hypothetical protein [Xanthomonadales bacterium]